MIAIILAAGFSTRLYPLTKTFPKALLKVNDQPILNQCLSQIITLPNLKQIYLVTNSLYFAHFSQYLKKNKLRRQIKLINNQVVDPENRLGAIGDLRLVLTKENINDHVLVVASDTLTSMKLADLVVFFRRKKTSVTALFAVNNLEIIKNRLGCAVINNRQQITEFVEKPNNPPSHLVAIPYYLFHQKDLDLIRHYPKTGLSMDSPGSLIGYLQQQLPTHAMVLPKNSYYYDIGTIKALSKAQKDVRIKNDDFSRNSAKIFSLF